MKKANYFLLLCEYWFYSFAIAVAGYYLLYPFMHHHQVFEPAHWIFCGCRYHLQHPIPFIIIPCFFYGIVATLFTKAFNKGGIGEQVAYTLPIIICTLFLSFPFGGMLVYYLDMKAGYFPDHWMSIIISKGIGSGYFLGWTVILSSFPYNILGAIVCFFLTKLIAGRFKNRH